MPRSAWTARSVAETPSATARLARRVPARSCRSLLDDGDVPARGGGVDPASRDTEVSDLGTAVGGRGQRATGVARRHQIRREEHGGISGCLGLIPRLHVRRPEGIRGLGAGQWDVVVDRG